MEWSVFSEQALFLQAAGRAVTSIEAGHGQSYDDGVTVHVHGPSLSDWKIRKAHQAYRIGGDGRYAYSRFKSYVRTHRIVVGEVELMGKTRAWFGVELLWNRHGPYASMLYICGSGMDVWIWDLIDALKRIGAAHTAFLSEPKLYIRGRKGWARAIKRLGIEVDNQGFVWGWQEALRDGR
jgi:hypothetical protein